MKIIIITAVALFASFAAIAQTAAGGEAGYSDAEVRRVDKDAQKMTLRHGPIPNLGMGDMTMVFRVADPRMLDGLKLGDKIRFKAEKVGGQYTVTEMEGANQGAGPVVQ